MNLMSGIPGARYVGSTASGPPANTNFHSRLGDVVMDATGQVYVCIQPGSPGVWSPFSSQGATYVPSVAWVVEDYLGPAAMPYTIDEEGL